MKPYADSNFFTKLYLVLPDSHLATALLEVARGRVDLPLPITWLHRLEIINAFEQQVFIGSTPGRARVTREQAAVAQASFRDDLARLEFVRPTPLLYENLARDFESISIRHTARHGFRAYDVVHVASALLLGCDTFWSFDGKACRLAKLEGLALRS